MANPIRPGSPEIVQYVICGATTPLDIPVEELLDVSATGSRRVPWSGGLSGTTRSTRAGNIDA